MSATKSPSEPASGFSLIEVVVATGLVLMVLLPLAAACAGVIARAGREARRPLPMTYERSSWDWPARLLKVRMEDDTLLIEALWGPENQLLLGLWADGWLVNEVRVSEPAQFPQGLPIDWSQALPQEIVLRLRLEDGAWGPPYRLLRLPSALEGSSAGSLDAAALLHAPQLGTFTLSITPPGAVDETTPPSRLILSSGGVQLSLGDAEQSWLSEPERDLDVYY